MLTAWLKGKTNVEITDGIKKAKGSDLQVLPIDEQMAEATITTLKGAKINKKLDGVVSLHEWYKKVKGSISKALTVEI